MEEGVKVWVRNPTTSDDEVWLAGEIVSKESKSEDSFLLEVQAIKGREELPMLRIPWDANGDVSTELMKRNADDQVAEDLIRLTHLNEPAILHALVERFQHKLIYTYTGPILIAVNPFQALNLYTDDMLEKYYEGGVARAQGFEVAPMPPHVYAIAASAYQDMALRLARQNAVLGTGKPRRASSSGVTADTAVSQSILISGESGSGKTVSTKHCLEYLTTVGQAAADRSKGLKLAAMQRDIDSNKIVQSNPILEAFGNARTLRNDNSSRFGKLVQMHFGGVGEILGGGISSYLLEKFRLVKQSKGERNFHIFYQLCASFMANGEGSSQLSTELLSETKAWKLGHAKDFTYANRGSVYAIRGVNDAVDLGSLRHAMGVLNFSSAEMASIFNITASLLHLGNVDFVEDDAYGSVLKGNPSESSARQFCELTGVDYTALVAALTTKDVSTKWEKVVKPLRPVDAEDAIDALSKALYSKLFDWVVAKINSGLGVTDTGAIQASVSVLDIFGFECFDENSLEQLCINYTNEKLQQQFNTYVFKLEEKEYTREGIKWSTVDFPDNQDILDMIEGKSPMGILTLLDDECNNPSGNDRNFADRIYKAFLGDEPDHGVLSKSGSADSGSSGDTFKGSLVGARAGADNTAPAKKHPRFDATKLMKPRGKFSVIHYAGPVTYCATGFWAKNRDELPAAASDLLLNSSEQFVSQLLVLDEDTSGEGGAGSSLSSSMASPNSKSASGKSKKQLKTVFVKFKAQLTDLLERLSITQPHYIRCLKPNETAEPFLFSQARVGEQLRYGGVLEAVRVSRSGFPVRMPHGDFYERYRRLVSEDGSASEAESSKNAHSLPLTLSDKISAAETEKFTLKLIKMLQSSPTSSKEEEYRAESVQFGKTKVFFRQEAHDALEARIVSSRTRAATKLQTSSRRNLATKDYFLKKSSAVTLQKHRRGQLCRKELKVWYKSAVLIQVVCRMRSARKTVEGVRVVRKNQAALDIQKTFRGMPARRSYLKMSSASTLLQCALRCKRAVAMRKKLAVEAKSVDALKKKNEELMAKLEQQKKDDEEARAKAEVLKAEEAQAKAKEEASKLRSQIETLEDELAQEKEAHSSDNSRADLKIQSTAVEINVLNQKILSLEEDLRSEQESREHDRSQHEVDTQTADQAYQKLSEQLAALDKELWSEKEARAEADASTKEAERALNLKVTEIEKLLSEEQAKREDEAKKAQNLKEALESDIQEVKDELLEEKNGRVADVASSEAKLKALEEEAASRIKELEELIETERSEAKRISEEYQKEQASYKEEQISLKDEIYNLSSSLSDERELREQNNKLATEILEDSRTALKTRSLKRIVLQIGYKAPVSSAWLLWVRHTRSVAEHSLALKSKSQVDEIEKQTRGLKRELKMEQDQRVEDSAAANEMRSTLEAKLLALEERITANTVALDKEKEKAQAIESNLSSQLNELEERYNKEKAGRQADSQAHSESMASMEESAKVVCDQLRAQVESLAASSAKDREARMAERANLDAKNQSISGEAGNLKMRILELENQLSHETAQRTMELNAARRTQEELTASQSTLEVSLAAEKASREADAANAIAAAEADRRRAALRSMEHYSRRMCKSAPLAAAWRLWGRFVRAAVEHAASMALADAQKLQEVEVQKADARVEEAAVAHEKALAEAQSALEETKKGAASRLLWRALLELGQAGPLQRSFRTWTSYAHAAASQEQEEARLKEAAEHESMVVTLESSLAAVREEQKAGLSTAESTTYSLQETIRALEAERLEANRIADEHVKEQLRLKDEISSLTAKLSDEHDQMEKERELAAKKFEDKSKEETEMRRNFRVQIETLEDELAQEKVAHSSDKSRVDLKMQGVSVEIDVLNQKVLSLEEDLRSEQESREHDRSQHEVASQTAEQAHQKLSEQLAALDKELWSEKEARAEADASAKEAERALNLKVTEIEKLLSEEQAKREDEAKKAQNLKEALESDIQEVKDELLEEKNGRVADAVCSEAKLKALDEEAALRIKDLEELIETERSEAKRISEEYQKEQASLKDEINNLSSLLSDERELREENNESAHKILEESRIALKTRSLKRIALQIGYKAPVSSAWLLWARHTRFAAERLLVSQSSSTAGDFENQTQALKRELKMEQDQRAEDSAAAKETQSTLEAKLLALEEQITANTVALDEEKEKAQAIESNLSSQLNELEERYNKEKAGRQADSQAHSESMASMEESAKVVCDQLRDQVKSLAASSAKDREARMAERANLDAKNQSISGEAGNLKMRILELENQLSHETAQRTMELNAARRTQEELTASQSTLEVSLAAEKASREADAANAIAAAEADRRRAALRSMEHYSRRMCKSAPLAAAWRLWGRFVRAAAEHAASMALADAQKLQEVEVQKADARVEEAAVAHEKALAEAQSALEETKKGAASRLLWRALLELGQAGPLQRGFRTWTSYAHAAASQEQEEARRKEAEEHESMVVTLESSLAAVREEQKAGLSTAESTTGSLQETISRLEADLQQVREELAAQVLQAQKTQEDLQGQIAGAREALARSRAERVEEGTQKHAELSECQAQKSAVEEELAKERSARALLELQGQSGSVALDVLRAQLAAADETLQAERADRIDQERDASRSLAQAHEEHAALEAEVADLCERERATAKAHADALSELHRARQANSEALRAAEDEAASADAALKAASEKVQQLNDELEELSQDAEAAAAAASASEADLKAQVDKLEANLAREQAQALATAEATHSARLELEAQLAAAQSAASDAIAAREAHAVEASAATRALQEASTQRCLSRLMRQMGHAAPLASAWQQWRTHTAASIQSAKAAAKAAEQAAAEAAALERQRAAAQKAADEARAAQEAATAESLQQAQASASEEAARVARLQVDLASATEALNTEKKRVEANVAALQVRLAAESDALVRERAGRSTDARNHAEALATVEARAKTVTEELREQVGSLVTAMAKERTVRGKQRGELDAKASSAATSLSLLKGQLASTEELLESCREDAKMASEEAASVRSQLEARIANLEEEVKTATASYEQAELQLAATQASALATTNALEAQLAAELAQRRSDEASAAAVEASLVAQVSPLERDLRKATQAKQRAEQMGAAALAAEKQRSEMQVEVLRQHVAALTLQAERDRNAAAAEAESLRISEVSHLELQLEEERKKPKIAAERTAKELILAMATNTRLEAQRTRELRRADEAEATVQQRDAQIDALEAQLTAALIVVRAGPATPPVSPDAAAGSPLALTNAPFEQALQATSPHSPTTPNTSPSPSTSSSHSFSELPPGPSHASTARPKEESKDDNGRRKSLTPQPLLVQPVEVERDGTGRRPKSLSPQSLPAHPEQEDEENGDDEEGREEKAHSIDDSLSTHSSLLCPAEDGEGNSQENQEKEDAGDAKSSAASPIPQPERFSFSMPRRPPPRLSYSSPNVLPTAGMPSRPHDFTPINNANNANNNDEKENSGSDEEEEEVDHDDSVSPWTRALGPETPVAARRMTPNSYQAAAASPLDGDRSMVTSSSPEASAFVPPGSKSTRANEYKKYEGKVEASAPPSLASPQVTTAVEGYELLTERTELLARREAELEALNATLQEAQTSRESLEVALAESEAKAKRMEGAQRRAQLELKAAKATLERERERKAALEAFTLAMPPPPSRSVLPPPPPLTPDPFGEAEEKDSAAVRAARAAIADADAAVAEAEDEARAALSTLDDAATKVTKLLMIADPTATPQGQRPRNGNRNGSNAQPTPGLAAANTLAEGIDALETALTQSAETATSMQEQIERLELQLQEATAAAAAASVASTAAAVSNGRLEEEKGRRNSRSVSSHRSGRGSPTSPYSPSSSSSFGGSDARVFSEAADPSERSRLDSRRVTAQTAAQHLELLEAAEKAEAEAAKWRSEADAQEQIAARARYDFAALEEDFRRERADLHAQLSAKEEALWTLSYESRAAKADAEEQLSAAKDELSTLEGRLRQAEASAAAKLARAGRERDQLQQHIAELERRADEASEAAEAAAEKFKQKEQDVAQATARQLSDAHKAADADVRRAKASVKAQVKAALEQAQRQHDQEVQEAAAKLAQIEDEHAREVAAWEQERDDAQEVLEKWKENASQAAHNASQLARAEKEATALVGHLKREVSAEKQRRVELEAQLGEFEAQGHELEEIQQALQANERAAAEKLLREEQRRRSVEYQHENAQRLLQQERSARSKLENELEDRGEQLANEQAKCADLEEQVNSVLHAAKAFELVEDEPLSSHRQPSPSHRQSSSSQPRTPSSANAVTPGARPPSGRRLASPSPLSPSSGGYNGSSGNRSQRHYDSTPPMVATTTPRRASPQLPFMPSHDHDDDDDYRGGDDHNGGSRLRERMRQTPPRPSQSAPRPSRGLGAILKSTSAFGGRSNNQGS